MDALPVAERAVAGPGTGVGRTLAVVVQAAAVQAPGAGAVIREYSRCAGCRQRY